MIHDLQRFAATFERKDALDLPGWSSREWDALNSFAAERTLSAGEVLIKRGETERAINFVTEGELEGSPFMARAEPGAAVSGKAGSVVGNQSFSTNYALGEGVACVEPATSSQLRGAPGVLAWVPDRALELLSRSERCSRLRLRYATTAADRAVLHL